MAQGQIKFGVGFNVDKSGLNTLKASLKEIQKLTTADIKIGGNAEKTLKDIQGMASQVEGALEKAFNPNLGTINLTKFNNELKSMGLSVGQMGQEFSKAGAKGDAAFRNLTTQLLTTKVQVKQTHELLDKMANTLANTVRWTIASSAVNALTGSIQKAYNYTVDLDTSLNDIRIVTEKSADEMDRFAIKANNAAKVLGASTKAYSDASLIYFQQGLNDEEVEKRTQVTLKAANVTGQSAAAVSEQLTAVWNGYKITAENTESAIDKLAAVAASTAADLEELSTGMSRVASAANIMGVDIDQLNAQLATIVSVTREAPESIGTALKTIYARMSDLEAGTDAETTLGEYTQQMAQFGFQALDTQGNLRDMGDVIEEIGDRWGSLSRNQQVALAQTVAGTRQYARLMSLFDNWEMYEESLQTSINSTGTLQKQQDIYMESTEAHLQKLSTQAEELYSHLFDSESVNDVADALTNLVELVDGFVQSVGGGAGILQMLGTVGLNVFGTQISKGISTTIKNLASAKDATKQLAAQEAIARELGLTDTQNEQVKTLIKYKQDQLQLSNILSDADNEWYNSTLVSLNDIWKKQDEILRQKEEYVKTTNKEINAEKAKQKAIADQYKKGQDGSIAFSANGIALGGYGSISKQLEQLHTRQRNQATYKTEEEHAKKLAAAAPINSKSKAYNLQELANLAPIMTENEVEIKNLISSISKSNISLDQIYEDALKLRDQFEKGSEKYNKIQSAINEMDAKIGGSWGVDEEGKAVHHFDAAKKPETRVRNIEVGLETQSIMAEVIAEANEEIKEYSRSIEISSKAEEKMSTQTKELDKKLESLKTQAGQTEEQLTTFKESFNLEKSVQQVVSLVGNVTNLVTGIKMLGNLGDIWDNEDLDTGEKFAQILTNVTMAGGLLGTSVVPMIQKVIAGYQQYKKATEAIAAAEQTLVIAKRASAMINQQSITDTNILNLAKRYNVEVTEEEIKADRAAAIEKVKSAIASTQQSATETIETSVIQKNTAATLKNIAAKALQHWYILAIVAAVGLVAAAIYAGVKAYNADAEAAREAAKVAEELKTAYEDVKTANEELKKSLTDYSEAQKALDEMTKGTKEWEEALRDANIQVLDLIKQYPELLSYLDKTEDGRFILTQEGLDIAANKGNAAVKSAFVAKTYADIYASQKQFTSDVTNKARETGISYTYTDDDGNSYITSATATQVEPVIQAILKQGDAILDTQETLSTATGITDPALLKSLMQNREALLELSKELEVNTEVNRLQSQQAAKDYLSIYGGQSYQGSQYQDQIAQVFANVTTQQDKVDAAKREFENIQDSEIHKLYAEYMVESGQWQSFQSSKNKTGKGSFTYVDASGKQQSEIEIDDDVMRTALATQKLLRDEGKNTESTIAAIAELASLGGVNKDLSVGLANLAGQQDTTADFSMLTAAQVQQLKEIDLSSISEEDAKAMGYDSLEKLKETITKSVTNYETALTTAADSLSETAKSAFNSLFEGAAALPGLKDLTLKNKQNFANLYKQIFDIGGTDALEGVKTILTDAGNEADELVNLLTENTLDWTSDNIEEELTKKLKELKIELDTTNFNNLIIQMQELNGISQGFNLEEAQQTLTATQNIIKNLSGYGDTISAEDYEKLGEGAENYFTQMADGTYMLTASVSEFTKAMKEYARAEALEKLKKDWEEAEDALEDLSLFSGLSQPVKTKTAVASNSAIQTNLNTIQSQYDDDNRAGLVEAWLKTPEGKKFASAYQTTTGKTVDLASSFDQWNGSKINVVGISDSNEYATLDPDTLRMDLAKHYALLQNERQVTSTNRIAAQRSQGNIAILNSMSDETLSKFGITRSQLDNYNTELNRILSQSTIAGTSDLNLINEIQNLVSNLNYGEVDLSNLKNGIIQQLKTASSDDELQQIKDSMKEMFGYDTAPNALKEMLDTAFADTSIDTVVANNYLNKQLKIMESQAEAISKINSEYEHMNSLLDQQRNLIKLTMGEDAYEEMKNSYAKSITAIEGIMSNNKASMDRWAQEMENALAMEDKEMGAKLYEEAKAQWEEASSAYYESMSQKIELLKEQEINAINAVFKARESANGKSLDYMTENWELSKTKSDMWLDPVNAAYGIDQVRSKFNKALNNTSDINAQRQIRNLMEEQLEALESQDKLSEYDLKRAEAKLNILEKEIALRDAQNNKTKMQLMRGADGSYSYQYVADASAMVEAEEELAAAQNKLYNIDLDEYKLNLDNVLQYYQEFKDKWLEVAVIANDQERQDRQQMLKDQYFGEDGILTLLTGSDNQQVFQNLAESMGGAFEGLFGEGADLQQWINNLDFDELTAKLEETSKPFKEAISETAVFNESLDSAIEKVTTIANIMAEATWGEGTQLTETGYGWDSEALAKAIVDGLADANIYNNLAKLKLEWVGTDENDPTKGSFQWVASAATGAYTGEWGSEGRFIRVHEKELILNQEDTANILNAVDMVRSMKAQLEDSMLRKVLSFEQQLGTSMAAYELAKDLKIEQNVHISAEFPNVSEKSEIEEAFEELINLATQHAFDRRK